ncbi:MAG: alpha/beta hydrolase [PVC group bacterium]|nr:alpha/beta hydrolase [PVC group bacterium]
MMKIFLTILAFFLFVYCYARYLERSALYYPEKEIVLKPNDVGLAFEEVHFTAKDKVKLHGWYIPAKDAQTSLIFCHGNGGNISHRMDKILLFNNLGVNMFIFDYRGYGKSKGRSSEAGFYNDAEAAYKYLKSRGDAGRKIIIYGESLGGAVAVDLAAKVPVAGLILESTFTNVLDMAKVVYPLLPGFLVQSKFDSLSKIKTIDVPKLCMHSQDDNIVPFRLGKKLFDAASEPKQFLEIYGAHNDSFLNSEEEIKIKLRNFFREI